VKYSTPGLGGRLQRARKNTGLSQKAIANQLGISWMTVHRWERSERGVPDHLLLRVCELYDRPLSWFLTLEEGDLEDQQLAKVEAGSDHSKSRRAGLEISERIAHKIAKAPAAQRAMIEKVVEDMIDGLKRAS